jgi:hypothetical protein
VGPDHRDRLAQERLAKVIPSYGRARGVPDRTVISGESRSLTDTPHTTHHTALYPVIHRINTYLMRWIMNKYKKLRTWKKATQAMAEAAATRPRYFAHWAWAKPAAR